MNFFSRWLTIWVLCAMGIGIGVGYIAGVSNALNASVLSIGNYNIVLTIFLIFMMIPAFMKLNFSDLKLALKDWKVLLYSFVLNWIVGPFLMFGLAVGIIHEVDFRTGVIIIGLARCIAMVLVWNNLAEGNREHCVTIVIFNSILQIILFTFLVKWFAHDLPSAWNLGVISGDISISMRQVAITVSIYMFLPFILGVVIHYVLRFMSSEQKYVQRAYPVIDIIGAIGLLVTIFYLFAVKGKQFGAYPIPGLKIIAVLLIYFVVMFFMTMGLSFVLKIPFDISVTLSFTAASNNFELAIATAVGIFGVNSPEAFAATIGPLLEVPVMLCLVKVVLVIKSIYLRKRGKHQCQRI